MKKIVGLAVGVLFLSAFSQVAHAQQVPGNGPASGVRNETGKTVTPEQFQEKKAHVLKMIEEHRAKLDQAKACIEAASNIEELRKCRPEPPMGMGPGAGMRRGGPREQRPAMSPSGENQ